MSLKFDLRKGSLVLAALIYTFSGQSQIADSPDDNIAGIPVNYTETKVRDYALPDLLKCTEGQPVDNPEILYKKRRH